MNKLFFIVISIFIVFTACNIEREIKTVPNNYNEVSIAYLDDISIVSRDLLYCYRAVVDYYDSPHNVGDKVESGFLPQTITIPVCSRKDPFDLLSLGKKQFKATNTIINQIFEKCIKCTRNNEFRNILKSVIKGGVDACYYYTKESIKEEDNVAFICHAYTDLDSNGKYAHWMRKGYYVKECSCFKYGLIERNPKADLY